MGPHSSDWWRFAKRLAFGSVGFLLVLFVLRIPIVSRRFETCAACRADRKLVYVLGFERASVEDTEASRWYRVNVEPSHGHVWVSPARCIPFGIPFISYGVACTMGSPIFQFESDEQVEIYSHFEDRQAAKSLFVGIGRYQSDAGEGYLLLEWKFAGYPGTYAGWKREFLARRDASLREP